MFNLKENKLAKIILFIIVLSGFVLVLANSQLKVTEVSATVIAVVVHEDHLDFGTVFPGEERQGNFTVHYVQEYEGDGVVYQIIQKRKPLPVGHPEHPDGGDPEMPGYYRNLCEFLTKVSNEGEGDVEDRAFVGETDVSDEWIIYFKVPAIVGHIAQEHVDGVVTTNGEYGCDISINVLEP